MPSLPAPLQQLRDNARDRLQTRIDQRPQLTLQRKLMLGFLALALIGTAIQLLAFGSTLRAGIGFGLELCGLIPLGIYALTFTSRDALRAMFFPSLFQRPAKQPIPAPGEPAPAQPEVRQ